MLVVTFDWIVPRVIRTGHRPQAQQFQGQEMLWGLVRSHQERAALVRRMAERDLARNRGDSAADWERRALACERDAATIQQLIAAEAEVWTGADEQRGIEAPD